MTSAIDLDAYFDRIRWDGEVRPDLATLSSLVRAHMAHIPFENLDVLLGRPIRLNLDALQAKLVQARRGGYCFEHSTLFGAVLERLGFDVTRKLARVTLLAPREAVARTHMFLLVNLPEGRFVADTGFGSLAPSFPLPLVHTPFDKRSGLSHWMSNDGKDWAMCALAKGEVVQAWVSTLEDEGVADFEMGNHFVSTHPDSIFVNRILLRAITPQGRVTAMNRDVTIWRGDASEAIELTDRTQLRALLSEHFGFDMPEVEALKVPAVSEWS